MCLCFSKQRETLVSVNKNDIYNNINFTPVLGTYPVGIGRKMFLHMGILAGSYINNKFDLPIPEHPDTSQGYRDPISIYNLCSTLRDIVWRLCSAMRAEFFLTVRAYRLCLH